MRTSLKLQTSGPICLTHCGSLCVCVCVCVPECCTWDALALDSLGDDGEGLVAGLTQHLAQLLHTVAVHNDGMPAGKTEEVEL